MRHLAIWLRMPDVLPVLTDGPSTCMQRCLAPTRAFENEGMENALWAAALGHPGAAWAHGGDLSDIKLALSRSDISNTDSETSTMQKLLFLALLMAAGVSLPPPSSAQPTSQAEPAAMEPADPLKGLPRYYEELTGISTYRSAYRPAERQSTLELQFQVMKDGLVSPVAVTFDVISYDGRWMERVWASIDGEDIELPPEWGEQKDWGVAGFGDDVLRLVKVVELTQSDEIALIRRVAFARTATIHFDSLTSKARVLTLERNHLQALRQFIATYEAVAGKAWE